MSGPLTIEEVRERLAQPGWKGFALLRRYRRENPTSGRALARQVRQVRWDAREDIGSRRVRFAFVGSASTANLDDALLLESLDRGIVPVSYHATAGRLSSELRDPGSGLQAYQPDVAVVAANPRPEAGSLLGTEDASEFLDSLLADLRAFRERSRAVLLVHSFLAPEFRPRGLHDWRDPAGLGETYGRLNLALAEGCRELPDTEVIDVARLVALSGASWWSLHRSGFLAGVGSPEELSPLLCRDYAAVGAALRGFVRKCLVLDLDDTLWGGVVGEVGADQVQIGRDYPGNIHREIQQLVRQLAERGVVLALNSRNHEADAWAPFQTRAEMRLEPRHFAAWRINWQDKATNLRELSEELRLGLDSFVFLDNDPVERAWVEERLPEVHVIPAEDPLDMLRALAGLRLFDGLALTEEDAGRAQSYQAATARRAEEATAADRASFLAGLDLAVTVGWATPGQLPRLAQLAQRTNQFNLTTRRYTEGQLRELCASAEAEVLYCSCRDRLADEGVVGLAVLRGPGGEWTVDTFLLSCRVLGWGVERAFAAAVCQVVAGRGATSLRGEYLPSARNGIAEGFYREIGFSPGESDGGGTVWRTVLPVPAEVAPPWIHVRIEGAAS